MSDTFPMPCAQWAARLAALHPRDLSEAERTELTGHIVACPACAAVLADYQRFAEQLRHVPHGPSQSALPPQLRAFWEAQSDGDKQGGD